jgi:hypothetical protein
MMFHVNAQDAPQKNMFATLSATIWSSVPAETWTYNFLNPRRGDVSVVNSPCLVKDKLLPGWGMVFCHFFGGNMLMLDNSSIPP